MKSLKLSINFILVALISSMLGYMLYFAIFVVNDLLTSVLLGILPVMFFTAAFNSISAKWGE